MGLDYYASSPTLVLAPVLPAQPSHYRIHNPFDEVAMTDSCPLPATKKFAPKYPTPPSMNYLAKASNGVAGRKRSRADLGDDHEDGAGGAVAAPPKPKVEPIMGPGMTLIYPDEPQLNISPESQSGTWMEERADVQAKVEVTERPRIIARKSQRLISKDHNLPSNDSSEIDPVVMRLGIGWKRLAESQAAAVAGQQSFIENHFDLNRPEILLQHEGLGIYVVRSKPASAEGYWDQWWLFTDDLKSCRFLCHEENDLFRRLSNKRQDERGNWQPDILVEGPVIHAKNGSGAVQTAVSDAPMAVAVALDVDMQG